MGNKPQIQAPLTIVVHDVCAPTKKLSMKLNTPTWLIESLQKDFPEHRIVHAKTWDDVDASIPEMDVFLGADFDAERLKRATRLRYIHSPSSGVDFLMYPEMIASNVTIVKSPGIQSTAVAEHTLMLMLTLAKRTPLYLTEKSKQEWAQKKMIDEYESILELNESTIVLVGVGNIGHLLLKTIKALNMHVIVVRLHPEYGPGIGDEVVGWSDIKTVLNRADFLVLAAPLTDKTYNMIDREALGCLRSSAYVINVSRGQVINEEALTEALRNNTIAGAALDVFNEEPLPKDSPLWTLPNVFITPHCAGSSENRWKRTYELWRDNLRRFLRGERLENTVEKNRGF